jgi:hypothetical protein
LTVVTLTGETRLVEIYLFGCDKPRRAIEEWGARSLKGGVIYNATDYALSGSV